MRASQWMWLPALVISASAHATTYFTVEQAQRAIFPGATLAATAQPNAWRTSNGGYFVVTRVIGKHEYITLAVGINPNGTVKQIEIMQYIESYGYEVREAQWRAQFVGKSNSNDVRVNSDIRNISGATLSSTHLAEGVKKVLSYHASHFR